LNGSFDLRGVLKLLGRQCEAILFDKVVATFPMLRAPSPIHVELFLAKLSADAEIGFTRSELHAAYARWRTNNPRGRLVGSSLVNKTFMIMSASCGACGKFSNSREENSLHVFLFPLALLLLKISIS